MSDWNGEIQISLKKSDHCNQFVRSRRYFRGVEQFAVAGRLPAKFGRIPPVGDQTTLTSSFDQSCNGTEDLVYEAHALLPGSRQCPDQVQKSLYSSQSYSRYHTISSDFTIKI